MRFLTALLLAACLGTITSGVAGQTPPNPPADPEVARLHALFDAEWEWAMRTFPDWATLSGDHR